MEVTLIDIMGIVISGLIWITAVVALILGCIFFNKRLKFYIYKENNMLHLVAFDKGNGACHISKAFYGSNRQNIKKMTQVILISDNELRIDLLPLGEYSKLYFLIIDNFGRKYKETYQVTNEQKK